MRSATDSSGRRIGSLRQTREGRGTVNSDARRRVFTHRRSRRALYLPWQFNLLAFAALFIFVLLLVLRLAWIE